MASPLRKILNDGNKFWGDIAKAGNVGVDQDVQYQLDDEKSNIHAIFMLRVQSQHLLLVSGGCAMIATLLGHLGPFPQNGQK